MNKTILIVDDEESIRTILTDFLTMSGYKAVAVSSALEARQAVQQKHPNMIISDLQLEDSDGLDMIRQLKVTVPNAPVMLLTGMLFDPRVAEDLMKKDVSSYLPKTTPLSRILEEVQRLIGKP
jgi:two-component system response regulator HydG